MHTIRLEIEPKAFVKLEQLLRSSILFSEWLSRLKLLLFSNCLSVKSEFLGSEFGFYLKAFWKSRGSLKCFVRWKNFDNISTLNVTALFALFPLSFLSFQRWNSINGIVNNKTCYCCLKIYFLFLILLKHFLLIYRTWACEWKFHVWRIILLRFSMRWVIKVKRANANSAVVGWQLELPRDVHLE